MNKFLPRVRCRGRTVIGTLTLLSAAIIIFSMATAALAQQDYKTPQDAVDALVATARSGDQKAALTVLGHGGEDIISSGDKVSDDAVRARFVTSYDAKHAITMEGDSKAILVIGDNDYPFPIPIAHNKNGTWSFDTEAGRHEILYRRIGHNELDAIQTCLAYVDAQNEYASKDRTGAGANVYAQRFVSASGKKDGLYWPTVQGEEQSPLGELFAAASRQGYRAGEGRSPYHGYYYKILTKQGPAANGGAADYVVNGNMIGGFALVAYPAQYRNSGVMTFIVNYAGTVFQKDLGHDTTDIAGDMTSFNPDQTWKKVDVAEPEK
ncbi:MAG: DUF2950 domain-containing protein [Xanthobacteraceae bacterium]